MGLFDDWNEDQDSYYDWGSQFGKPNLGKKQQPVESPAVTHTVETNEEKPKSEEPKPIESKPEEPKQENPQPEESKPEEPKQENPQPEESKPEEPKQENPQPEESKLEEPKPEEPDQVEFQTLETEPKETIPLTREDLQKIAAQQQTCQELADGWRDRFQQILSPCAVSQLPKGIPSIKTYLGHLSDTAIATKALVDYYLETDEQQKFQTIVDSTLEQFASSTYVKTQMYEEEMKKALDLLEERIGQDEERHVLNLTANVISDMANNLDNCAACQAKAFSEALDAYSPSQGTLAMLERFANRGDRKVMASIDNTLNLAGTDMVMTEDASAMLEALEHDDTDTIVRLQQKLIDHLFEKK